MVKGRGENKWKLKWLVRLRFSRRQSAVSRKCIKEMTIPLKKNIKYKYNLVIFNQC